MSVMKDSRLVGRRVFAVDDAVWAELLAILDRPVSHPPRLQELFAEASVFDES
jgi:uncharacterized protein (DUF1778 family)